MNPLENYPRARTVVYTLLSIFGLALGSTQVGFAAADAGQPTWLTVALAVFAFVGGAVGFTARQNTPATPAP